MSQLANSGRVARIDSAAASLLLKVKLNKKHLKSLDCEVHAHIISGLLDPKIDIEKLYSVLTPVQMKSLWVHREMHEWTAKFVKNVDLAEKNFMTELNAVIDKFVKY